MRRGSSGPEERAIVAPIIAVLALAVFVAVTVLVATASGLGVSPDSVAYLSLADEFNERGSPYAVLAPSPTHYAPLWSMLVGGVSAVTGIEDLLGIGRYVNAVLAAAVAPLVYVAVRRSTAAPAWWGILAATTAALMFGLFRLSVRALTEPMFVVLVILTLLLVEEATRRRSRPLLLGAAATAAALVSTRFVGVTMLVPLVVAAWRIAPGRSDRVVNVLTTTLITLGPTALWAAAAPATTTATHLGTGARGGLRELLESVRLSGQVVLDLPSNGFTDALFLLLGAGVLAAPFVAAVAVAANRQQCGGRSDRSRIDKLESSGLVPWMLFLVSYTALIAAQRWWIGREIIDRYWVPYVIVGLVVVARAIAETGLLRERRWRRVAAGGAIGLALANLAMVASFTATRSDRGIELNESRYQNATVFAEIARAGIDVVVTDSVRLVELHLVALGKHDVDVRDVGCRWSGESNAVAVAQAVEVPTAIVLAGVCDVDSTRVALQAIGGSEVLTEAGVGTLALIRNQ